MTLAANMSEKAAALATTFGQAAPETLIHNLTTHLSLLDTPRGSLPMTTNPGGAPTCYICCPSVAYLDYAASELRHFSGRPMLKAVLGGLIEATRPLVRASGLDQQVQPNNWLLSTNPVPRFSPGEIAGMTRRLTEAYPGQAIVWRSLNDHSDADSIAAFRTAGYRMLPARQIYLFDGRNPPARRRDEKRDAALLAAPDYAVASRTDIGAGDYERITSLYGRLYLEKYTLLNPQYSAAFVGRTHERGIIDYYGLRNADGVLDGFIGFFDTGEVMTSPVVGYDTALPQDLGLYRRLMAIAFSRARERKVLFNMSAGAASFKRNRGAIPALEYSAVYTRHLSPGCRAGGWLTRKILETVGIPILKRFEL